MINDGGQDTVPVRVSLVDANGVEIPTADALVTFALEGDGIIAGVGNGDPNSHEPDKANYRRLYAGLCQVLVTANIGARSLKLIAHAEGLEPASIEWTVRESARPDYIFHQPNLAITGVLADIADSPEKPDPNRVYGDDDMNSLAPIVLEKSAFNNYKPSGFKKGWRTIRIPITLPKTLPDDKIPAIKIESVICERAEFYVDGNLICEAEPSYKAALTIPCDLPNRREFEVRCLLKARDESISPNGFALGISLTLVDR